MGTRIVPDLEGTWGSGGVAPGALLWLAVQCCVVCAALCCAAAFAAAGYECSEFAPPPRPGGEQENAMARSAWEFGTFPIDEIVLFAG